MRVGYMAAMKNLFNVAHVREVRVWMATVTGCGCESECLRLGSSLSCAKGNGAAQTARRRGRRCRGAGEGSKGGSYFECSALI